MSRTRTQRPTFGEAAYLQQQTSQQELFGVVTLNTLNTRLVQHSWTCKFHMAWP